MPAKHKRHFRAYFLFQLDISRATVMQSTSTAAPNGLKSSSACWLPFSKFAAAGTLHCPASTHLIMLKRILLLATAVVMASGAPGIAQQATPTEPQFDVRAHYTKFEHYIPMRDGKRLFTAIYVPKDSSQKYPFLMTRTPYSVSPYGVDQYRKQLGPSPDFDRAGYIFVFQDV